MGEEIVLLVIAVSIPFQVAAAILSLSLYLRTKAGKGWLVISGGLWLMVLRRLMSLFGAFSGHSQGIALGPELVACLTSVLMFAGVVGIRSLFLSLKRAKEEIQRVWEEFRSVIESTDDSVYLVDPEGRFLYVNQRYLDRLGVNSDRVLGKRYGDFHSEEDTTDFLERVRRVIETGQSQRYEHRSLRDGHFFLRTLSPVRDPKGRVVAVTVVSKDITDLKKVQLELSFLATHDPLTGLPNRALFMDRLKLAILQAQRNPHPMAVMFIDLDDFKKVNDAYGHRVGDALLKAIGKRLRDSLRRSDTVARIGGDEFVVLLPDIRKHEDAALVACHLLEQLSLPYEVEGRTFEVSGSIGIALYPDHGTDPETLLMIADKAMYEAKSRRRGYWIWGSGCFEEKGA